MSIRVRRSGVVRAKWSVAIADQRGVLYHADERFRSCVTSAWGRDDPGRLPPALLARLVGDGNGPRTLMHEGVIL